MYGKGDSFTFDEDIPFWKLEKGVRYKVLNVHWRNGEHHFKLLNTSSGLIFEVPTIFIDCKELE